MSRTALRIVCMVLLAAFVAGAVFAQPLAPEPRHRDITRKIAAIMASYNFQNRALDDALSRDVFTRFLDTLDAGKLYLLREDVDRFAVHREQLDDYLRHGQLAAVYQFFEVYRRRFNQRMEHAIALVDGGFDFSVDEEWRYQRDDADWAAGSAQLDEIWRKRIKNDFLELRLDGIADAEARDMLAQRYRSRMRSYAQLKTDEVYQWFINSYTTSVDPHTSYLPPRSSEDFNIDMSLSLQGIGAVLQADNEYTKVRELVQGGPAAAGGELRPGDRITGVAQGQQAVVNVVGWRLDDVVRLIRGPKGSLVRLEILPAKNALRGPKKIIAIVRDTIKLTRRAAGKKILHTGGEGEAGARKIGVVTLPIFYHDFRGQHSGGEDYNSASRDVARLLGELKAEGVDGVVLDLRGNSGGALTEAVALTGLFIDRGPVVQVKEANGLVKVERDRDPGVAWDGPLAVLVDRYSASASEIFASAIQDHRRGLVVGEPTYGKGTVQNLLPLGGRDSGQLKITFAQFFRVNGGSTQFRGVIPDLRLPTDDGGDYGERTLDNALPWSTINPVLQPPAAREDFARAVEQTVQLHRARLHSDAGLLLVRAENEQIRRNREQTTISLREAERRREREERETAERERREQYFGTMDGDSGGAGDDSGSAGDGSGGGGDDSDAASGDPGDFAAILLRETATALADFAELYRGPLIPGFSAAQ